MNFRKRLLKKKTLAEKLASILFWEKLNYKVVEQFRFKTKNNIYYLDFWLPHYQIAIELDGGIHEKKIERDSKRTEHILTTRLGGSFLSPVLLRFNNEDLYANSNLWILNAIRGSVDRQRATLAISSFFYDREILNEAIKYEEKKLHFRKPRLKKSPYYHPNNNLKFGCTICWGLHWKEKDSFFASLRESHFKNGFVLGIRKRESSGSSR